MSGFVKIAIDDYYSDSNWTTIINKYWLMAERVSDPRVQGWFLFNTPLPTLAMVLVYLTIVMVAGPLWMQTRKPFKLQKTLVAYNAFQVFLSLYMFYEHLMSGWWGDYCLTCQPVDYSESDKATRMLHLCWVYYFSKLSEFADTIFFVLRKKKSQITWLHLYHHSLTPFEAWLLVKFIAGGHGTFSNIVNNLVHVTMYAYYMVAAMGPRYHKYLWWKKHLTTLQLAQFYMVLIHSISAVVYDCGYPKFIASGLILHSSIFIVLFTNFYIQAYKKRRPKQKEANNNDVTTTNGHVKSPNGHVTIENGHVTNGNGHVTSGNGHVITGNGHVTTSNGHIVSNGQFFSDNGIMTSENAHVIGENYYMNGYNLSENVFLRGENVCLKNGYTHGHINTEKEKVQ